MAAPASRKRTADQAQLTPRGTAKKEKPNSEEERTEQVVHAAFRYTFGSCPARSDLRQPAFSFPPPPPQFVVYIPNKYSSSELLRRVVLPPDSRPADDHKQCAPAPLPPQPRRPLSFERFLENLLRTEKWALADSCLRNSIVRGDCSSRALIVWLDSTLSNRSPDIAIDMFEFAYTKGLCDEDVCLKWLALTSKPSLNALAQIKARHLGFSISLGQGFSVVCNNYLKSCSTMADTARMYQEIKNRGIATVVTHSHFLDRFLASNPEYNHPYFSTAQRAFQLLIAPATSSADKHLAYFYWVQILLRMGKAAECGAAIIALKDLDAQSPEQEKILTARFINTITHRLVGLHREQWMALVLS